MSWSARYVTVPSGAARWSPGVAGALGGRAPRSPGSFEKSIPPFWVTRIEPSVARAAPLAPPPVTAMRSVLSCSGQTRYSAPPATLVATTVPSGHHTGPSANGMPVPTTTDCILRGTLRSPAMLETPMTRVRVLDPTAAPPAVDPDPGPDAGALRDKTVGVRFDRAWRSGLWGFDGGGVWRGRGGGGGGGWRGGAPAGGRGGHVSSGGGPPPGSASPPATRSRSS